MYHFKLCILWLTHGSTCLALLLAVVVLILVLPCGPVLCFAAFLVIVAAVWLLLCAGWLAAFVEKFWPNLAERLGLVWLRELRNDLLRRRRADGLGNP